MFKNSIALLIIFLFVQIGYSQVPPPQHINVKVYDQQKLISADDDDLILTAYSYSRWSVENQSRIHPDDIKGQNGIEVIVDYAECVTLDMRINGRIMVIHTPGNIDSISFMEGEYFLNYAENYLFSIRLGENQKWKNFDINNFKKEIHFTPTFMLESNKYHFYNKLKACNEFTEKLEEEHGGKYWAKNVCREEYKEPIIGDTIQEVDWIINELKLNTKNNTVKIYPFLNTKFIKYEIISKNESFDHRFSITEDNGKSWKEIMYIENEWYVQLIYFPDEDKLGVYIINGEILLLSDYNFLGWSYYFQKSETDGDKRKSNEKKVGLIFQNENWEENYFGSFIFLE